MIERLRDKRRARRKLRVSDASIGNDRPPPDTPEGLALAEAEARSLAGIKESPTVKVEERDALDKELVSAVRLLLRQALSGAVSPVELQKQMIRLDALMGHEWAEKDEFRRHNSPRGTKSL